MSNQKEIGQKGMMNMGDKGMMGKGMMDGKMMGMMGMCPMMQSMMQKQVVPTSDGGIIGIRPTNAGPPGLDSGNFFWGLGFNRSKLLPLIRQEFVRM